MLVVSVTPFKLDQNKNQNRSINKVQNLGNEKRGKKKDPVWRRHAGAHLNELQQGGRKPTETSVIEFCYKSVNLFFEEFINIKVIHFLIHELFR